MKNFIKGDHVRFWCDQHWTKGVVSTSRGTLIRISYRYDGDGRLYYAWRNPEEVYHEASFV